METYTLAYAKQSMGVCCLTQGTQIGALHQSKGVGLGGREVPEGRDMCLPMSDSC